MKHSLLSIGILFTLLLVVNTTIVPHAYAVNFSARSGESDNSALTRLMRSNRTIDFPARTYRFNDIRIPANTTLNFAAGARIVIPVSRSGAARGFFITNVNNVRILGASNGSRLVVDYDSPIRVESRAFFVEVKNADDVVIRNVTVNDRGTQFSAIRCFDTPRNLTVQNITANDVHHGFALIQTNSIDGLTARNLRTTGGVTLRLEADDEAAGASGGIRNVDARNIRCSNGRTPVFMQPHQAVIRDVTIRNVTAVNCQFGIEIASPFAEGGLPAGRYGTGISVSRARITASPVSSRRARVIVRGNVGHLPGPLRSIFQNLPATNQVSRTGPVLRGFSIGAVLRRSGAGASIRLTDIRARGFDQGRFELITGFGPTGTRDAYPGF